MPKAQSAGYGNFSFSIIDYVLLYTDLFIDYLY